MKRLAYLLIVISQLLSCASNKLNMKTNSDTSHALRLLPAQDLRNGIQQYVNDHAIKAGWLVTCSVSLTVYNIRFANQQ